MSSTENHPSMLLSIRCISAAAQELVYRILPGAVILTQKEISCNQNRWMHSCLPDMLLSPPSWHWHMYVKKFIGQLTEARRTWSEISDWWFSSWNWPIYSHSALVRFISRHRLCCSVCLLVFELQDFCSGNHQLLEMKMYGKMKMYGEI